MEPRHEELLERVKKGPRTPQLLTEVNRVKEFLVWSQKFEEAAEMRSAEREIQAELRKKQHVVDSLNDLHQLCLNAPV